MSAIETVQTALVLAAAASCSLSAASLANGELGSIGRSRSRGGGAGGLLPVRRPAVALVAAAFVAAALSRPPLSRRRRICPCPRRRCCRDLARPCLCLQSARAADGRLVSSRWSCARGAPSARVPRRCRLRPAHRCGACGNRCCVAPSAAMTLALGAVAGFARAARRSAVCGRLRPDGRPDGDGGCDRDAAGVLPSGRRAARPRPVRARPGTFRTQRASHRRRLLGVAAVSARCFNDGLFLRRFRTEFPPPRQAPARRFDRVGLRFDNRCRLRSRPATSDTSGSNAADGGSGSLGNRHRCGGLLGRRFGLTVSAGTLSPWQPSLQLLRPLAFRQSLRRSFRCNGLRSGASTTRRLRRQRRALLHAIAERAQDRGEILAGRARQRGHRLRHDKTAAVERAGGLFARRASRATTAPDE